MLNNREICMDQNIVSTLCPQYQDSLCLISSPTSFSVESPRKTEEITVTYTQVRVRVLLIGSLHISVSAFPHMLVLHGRGRTSVSFFFPLFQLGIGTRGLKTKTQLKRLVLIGVQFRDGTIRWFVLQVWHVLKLSELLAVVSNVTQRLYACNIIWC